MRKSPTSYKVITFLELMRELNLKSKLDTEFRGGSGKERWDVSTGSCEQSTGGMGRLLDIQEEEIS